MTEPQSPPQAPTLSTVLGESLRIIKSLFPQLLFICFLFVFPKSFSSIAHPTRQNLIGAQHPFPDKYQPETLLALVFCGFSFFFSEFILRIVMASTDFMMVLLSDAHCTKVE